MKNPPAFQFYPKDFIGDLNVQSMTDSECGRYIKLLCSCWIEDGLPVNGGSPLVDKWLNQSPTVARCFIIKDGKYRNPRLDEEREKQKRWSEKSREGGLKSVENKRKFKGGLRVVQPKANQGSTLQSSSLSSSSSSLPSSPTNKTRSLERKGKRKPPPLPLPSSPEFLEFQKEAIPTIEEIFKKNGFDELLKEKKFYDYLLLLCWEYRGLDLGDELEGKLAHLRDNPLGPKSNLCLQFKNWFWIAAKRQDERQRELRVGRK